MQPRTLQQILTEMDGVYAPQVDSIRQRQAAIPGQIQAEEQGLQAKQETAFGDILSGARRRGTGVAFGGIPAGEQAKYTATEYLPALARLRQSGREQAMSLEDAILGINERKYSMGQNIFSQESQMAEQRRQFDEQLRFQREQAARAAAAAAASGGGFSPTLGGGGSVQGAQKGASNFLGNDDLRGRWAYQAKNGDNDAAVLLKYVGNDNVSNAVMTPGEYQVLKRYGVRGNYRPGNINNAFGVTF